MAASAGNVLDTVLGVGEEEYDKVLRWPPPPATCSTLCWESGRRDSRRCCGGRLAPIRRHCVRQCAGSREEEIQVGAAEAASAGNVLDNVLGVGEERYK